MKRAGVLAESRWESSQLELIQELEGETAADQLLNHDSSDGDSNWLVSYSDLVTLLLGFFVMMFIFSSVDQASFSQKMSKALQGSFGTLASAKLLKSLQSLGSTPGMKIRPIERGIEATFVSAALFESGSASLVPDAFISLKKLAREIKKTGAIPTIRVEGHTDDLPIKSQAYRSNWDLSGARAVTIVHFFEQAGFPAERLEAVGLGASQPEAPNRDSSGRPIPQNQTLNRRVVIKVLVDT